jgi:hypothetical protein
MAQINTYKKLILRYIAFNLFLETFENFVLKALNTVLKQIDDTSCLPFGSKQPLTSRSANVIGELLLVMKDTKRGRSDMVIVFPDKLKVSPA